MMEIFVALFGMIIAFVILFWLKKTVFILGFVFRIISLIFVGLFLLSIIAGYYVIQDAKNFKENFSNSTNLFLMKQEIDGKEYIISGVIIDPQGKYTSIATDKLQSTQKLYLENKIELLNTEYYKIFVMDVDSIQNVSNIDITDKNLDLTSKEARAVITSNNPKETLANILSEKTGKNKQEVLNSISVSDEELKGYIFSHYISQVFNPKNSKEMLLELKNDGIKVYDNSALFKAIKLIPESLISIIIDANK